MSDGEAAPTPDEAAAREAWSALNAAALGIITSPERLSLAVAAVQAERDALRAEVANAHREYCERLATISGECGEKNGRIAELQDALHEARAEVERAQQLAAWRAIQLSEVDQLRARIQAVRDLAARQPDRFLGWSVERPDGSSCFGTFSEQAGAERCAADVRRGLCPDARIVESYAPGSVDVDDVLAALGPVETPQEEK